jgi:hypothetical protein
MRRQMAAAAPNAGGVADDEGADDHDGGDDDHDASPSRGTTVRGYAVAAACCSRGRRRETICETPSPPIVTP